ncbi:MAG TPA: RICIN domain-containing protein [Polyangia bacterium]|jgi:hypothetical protein
MVIVALAAATVSSSCIRKEEKEEEAKGGPPPAPPPPPPEPARSAMAIDQNAKYNLVAAASGKCVQFTGRGTNEQAGAEIAPCDKSPAQQFKLQPAAGNYWRFINLHSGKCLDVQAISGEDGAIIQQFSCNGGPNQDWIVADAGPAGTIRLVARNSGKVLDVKGAGTADGTPIIQWGWRSAPNEQFKLAPVAAAEAPADKAGAPTGAGGDAKGGAGKAAKKEKPAKSKT